MRNLAYSELSNEFSDSDGTLEKIQSAYRKLAKKHHPDRGGSHEAMVALNEFVARLQPD